VAKIEGQTGQERSFAPDRRVIVINRYYVIAMPASVSL
jgi:hypothetical protein